MVLRNRFTVSLLALPLAFSLLSACSSDSTDSSHSTDSSKSSAPRNSQESLTYWLQTPTTLKSSIYDVPFYVEWQKRIGLNIRYTEISTAQAQESFNTMLASGKLPDVIEYNWLSFPGGPEKAIKDGYILRLNDLIDQYAPNLKSYLDAHPELDKLVKTDDGDYYAFPFLKEGGMTQQWAGPTLRKDWLEELGLDLPVTIEDWHAVLTAFKEKGATAPLTLPAQPNALQGFLDGAFVGAFGVIPGFYIDDSGKVQYGPLQSGYRQFLETMSKWYEEGLIDRNFTQTDRKTQDANMTTSASGATVTSGARIDQWEAALSSEDPKAAFAFAPYPVLTKGEQPKFGQKAWPYGAEGSAAISASAKHPERAVQALDYAYGDEGYTLFNYGIEGQSYTIEDGKPKLTELITNNPDKLSYLDALTLYTHTVNAGPYVESRELIDNLAVTNEDHDYSRWETDNLKHALPPVTIASEDSDEFARIMNDAGTMVSETSLKIILGTEPIEAYDRLVNQLKSLKIERAVQFQQEAYDRFLNR